MSFLPAFLTPASFFKPSAAAISPFSLTSTLAIIRFIGDDLYSVHFRGFEKGSGTKSAQHPLGRSGFWFLTHFQKCMILLQRNAAQDVIVQGEQR